MDFIDPAGRSLLEKHGLADFAALWQLELAAVDEPNTEHNGWSSVCRLELDGNGFFLKRQVNFFTRTLHRPLGESTAAREFRNILRYERLGIPSLQAAFYGESKVAGEQRAILLTKALDGWMPLYDLLPEWPLRQPADRQKLVAACASLVGQLHAAGLRHGCLYPKHLFLRETCGEWQGCLIDLEKTRRTWWGWRDKVRDLEAFLRNVDIWGEDEQSLFLDGYLRRSGSADPVELWLKRLAKRRAYKRERRR